MIQNLNAHRFVPRGWGVMTPAGRAPSGVGSFVARGWGVMTPAARPPCGLADLNFDDVLADMPLWSGTPAQKAIAAEGVSLALPNLQAPSGGGLMDWLRQNQTTVLIVGGSLLGLAVLGGGGRR
jgi:hypothetical protein